MIKSILPNTSSKVPEHTRASSNHAITNNTIAGIAFYVGKSNAEISKRIY